MSPCEIGAGDIALVVITILIVGAIGMLWWDSRQHTQVRQILEEVNEILDQTDASLGETLDSLHKAQDDALLALSRDEQAEEAGRRG